MALRTLSRAAVRELDRRAIEEHGVPSIVLMENAGRGCAEEALRMLGDARGPVLVLCGPGNNGADGLVIARTLWNRGRDARVVFVGPHAGLEGGSKDFQTNLGLWRGLGRPVDVLAGAAEMAGLRDELASAELVVDALFGTGLDRALREPWLGVVAALVASERPVLAVDIPSGLDADSGQPQGAAVRATSTVTFVAAKPGLLRARGPELCGRLSVLEIGIPRPLLEEAL